jgi:hypothetical protein
MISLSAEERTFLRKIVVLSAKTFDVFLGNVVDSELPNIDVFVNINNQIVEYRFDTAYYQNPTEFPLLVRNLSWKFMRYVKLLKYLESINYLYLYQESAPENESRFGRLIKDNPYIGFSPYDPEVRKLVIDYSYRTIVIGQTLVDFVKNEFKTQEQLRHEENMVVAETELKISKESLSHAQKGINLSTESLDESRRNLRISEESLQESKKSIVLSSKSLEGSRKNITIARWALCIAVILGVIGIFGSGGQVYYSWLSTKKNEIKIDSSQFHVFRVELKNIETRLDSLTASIKTRESIKLKPNKLQKY